MLGHFRKANVPAKRIVREFPVTADAHVPVGEFRVVTLSLIYAISKLNTRNHPVCYPFRSGTIRGCGCKLVSKRWDILNLNFAQRPLA